MAGIETFLSDGVKIAYREWAPDEGPTRSLPVLLIHGFASNHEVNWVSTGWVDTLVKDGFRVIAIDNRGHGASAKLYGIEDYGSPMMAEDSRRLLDHLGIRKAHIIGYSMGARIAAFLVLRHPDRVQTVTLSGLGINIIRGMGEAGDEIAAALEAPSLEGVTGTQPRMFRAFAEQTKSDLKALAACMRSGRVPITAAELRDISCPVLVVVGTEDAIAGSAAELAELIPGAIAVAPEGRDHMKTVGAREFKSAVLTFLAR